MSTHQTRLRVCSAARSASTPAAAATYTVERRVGGRLVAVEVVRLLAAHPVRSRRVLRGGGHGAAAESGRVWR